MKMFEAWKGAGFWWWVALCLPAGMAIVLMYGFYKWIFS